MGEDNPNAEVEANLLTGEGLYASAGSAFQQVKSDLDALAAGLQPAWIGAAYGAYMQKQSKLTDAVQAGSDVMQKGSVEIRKMYDAYIQADEKMREARRQAEAEELFMDVFMIITALLGVIAPLMELADLAFATGMEAIEEGAVDAGVVEGTVGADVSNVGRDIEDINFNPFGDGNARDPLNDISPYNSADEYSVYEPSENGSVHGNDILPETPEYGDVPGSPGEGSISDEKAYDGISDETTYDSISDETSDSSSDGESEVWSEISESEDPFGLEGRNYFICRSPLLIDFARLRARTLIIK